ncbi:MAG TPA: PKD domain-containing protein [Polyangiaceae bacterium]|nr:PKD domain-containing protein [Polyangiaceae bacterium]
MRRLALALSLAAAAFSGAPAARAVVLKLEQLHAGDVGAPQTFKVASITEAVGAVSLRWNFGDGTPSLETTELLATHTYEKAGHFTLIVTATDDASRTSDTQIFAAHYPLTATPPTHSSSIIFDAARGRVWNVNPDSGSVSVMDAQTLRRIREAPVGKQPRALALAPDGSVWVTNQLSDEITVLDGASGDVQTRIPLAYASQPHSLAFGPNGLSYVSLFATGKLVEIDPATRAPRRELAIGPTPAGVAVAADGRIFVTRFISPVNQGEVWVVSPDSLTVSKTIPLAFDQTVDTQSSGRGVPNYVSSMVISPDGTQGWVTAKKDNVARGKQRDGQAMTFDNFVRTAVCAIDLRTETEMLEKRQDIDNRSTPNAVAFSPVGDYGYVLVQPDNWLGITDAYTGGNLSGIKQVGAAPDGLVLLPDGRLFVSSYLSREVIVYDLSQSIASIDHTAPEALAKIRTVDVEPLPTNVLLGKQIFHNASDTRMGHAGYWACSSCHLGGMSDGRVWDFSDRGEGLRNTKSLLGVRGTGQGRVHWTGNMDEIQDFDRDIRDSFGGSGFMAASDYDVRKDATGTYDPFSAAAAGVSPELDALSAYFATFDQVPRSPFRNPDGSFTKDARLGREVFVRAGCPACHLGADFTDSTMDSPMHDVGTILPTSGGRLGAPLTGFDTPTLKGLWQSAPYLHDGRAATLLEVFTTYTKDNMGTVSNLTDVELGQLVRYLLELDDVPETVVPDELAPVKPLPMGPLGGTASTGCALTPPASFASAGAARATPGWWFVGAACAVALRRLRPRRSVS